MSLWDQLVGLVTQQQHVLVDEAIPSARVEGRPAEIVATAEQHYFRIKVAQMFLRDKARLLQDWYPAVHSVVQCSFAGKNVELPNIADTSRLLAQSNARGDIIAKNFMLIPLIPFKGGNVRLLAGLFAVEGQNKLKDFIGVMGGFAKLLAVPQLSSALDIAGPLAAGVQALVGGGGMHLTYHNSYVDSAGNGTPLRGGYIAAVRTADHTIRQRLLVIDNQLYEGASLDDPARKPYERDDFLLLHIELRETRDDWNELGSISKPYTGALDALSEAEDAKADIYLRQALTAALKADELTKADRRRVVDLIKADFADAKKALGSHGLIDAGFKDFQQRMNQAALAVPARSALALGEPTFDDILDEED